MVRCRAKQTFYWIVRGNCRIQREPAFCKGREQERFSKLACLLWTTLPDLIRIQVKILLRFSVKNTKPQDLYITNISTNPPLQVQATLVRLIQECVQNRVGVEQCFSAERWRSQYAVFVCLGISCLSGDWGRVDEMIVRLALRIVIRNDGNLWM